MTTPASLRKVLITGAGTGFGFEVAMRLAGKGFDVVAAVEVYGQVQTLKRQAAERGVTLQVEKLDVTHDATAARPWTGASRSSSTTPRRRGRLDPRHPGRNIRHQFEVNVTGPLLLTQASPSRWPGAAPADHLGVLAGGLNVNPFTGIYSASKHAVEAIAESMKDELQEFGVEVATMNPGPFLTGFNDRIFQTWESWEDDPQDRLFDYAKLAFPRPQFNPEPVYATLTALAAGEIDSYRNLEPKSMLEETKSLIERRGARRPPTVSAPATPASRSPST